MSREMKAPKVVTRTYYRDGENLLHCPRHAAALAKDNGWPSLAYTGAMKEKMRHYNDETWCVDCCKEKRVC